MTIAAGFLLDNQVLLCADTLVSYGIKVYDSKLQGWSDNSDKCSLGFAIAGNEPNAKMAIEDCIEGVESCPREKRDLRNITKILRTSILGINRQYVDGRPDEEKLSLLIGAWIPRGSGARLFSASGAGVVRRDYDCLGAGFYLGQYIIRPVFHRKMGIESATRMAIQAISAAKKHDLNCGGDTHFLTVSASGVSTEMPYSTVMSEHLISRFELECSQLLLDVGNGGMSAEEFEERLEDFSQWCRRIRLGWINNPSTWNSVLGHAKKQEEQSDPGLTTTDPSPPPPSPE
jgi:20S proteasome alpha/beta subunit